ncbi:hypothetical protein PC119_g26560, partial [Phytophthora cactorum]
ELLAGGGERKTRIVVEKKGAQLRSSTRSCGTQWKERDILSVCQTGIEVVQVKKSRLESTAENLLVRMEEKAKLTPLLDASQSFC